MTCVAGIDGTRGGWVALVLEDGGFRSAFFEAKLEPLIERLNGCDAIAVDMPIGLPLGLPDMVVRAADQAARDCLPGRARSVFSVPPKAVLEAEPHAAATKLCVELTGKGLSQQSYALRHKILELDGLAQRNERIFEVHPEVSFVKMSDGAVRDPKKTWGGLKQRVDALRDQGIEIPADAGEAGAIPPDDVLDAAAAAWSAIRCARGDALPLPDPAEQISGRAVAIRY